MDELTQLAIKYGADKWGKHHYTPVYFDLFKDRQAEVSKVLEIGIAEGASLFMWRDFFPNALIHGAEIEIGRVKALENRKRIYTSEFDQKRLIDLLSLSDNYDLVVDDGSHRPQDQLLTCLILMPRLVKYVTYVIEDVSDPDIIKYLSDYDAKLVRVGKRYDDQLIIVKHK